jgi:hypothetical protein
LSVSSHFLISAPPRFQSYLGDNLSDTGGADRAREFADVSSALPLDRTPPGLPLKKGRCGTMTHDYIRHGTTTLFAALNVLDGSVIDRCMQQHRHQEFIRFLNAIEAAVRRRSRFCPGHLVDRSRSGRCVKRVSQPRSRSATRLTAFPTHSRQLAQPIMPNFFVPSPFLWYSSRSECPMIARHNSVEPLQSLRGTSCYSCCRFPRLAGFSSSW